MTEELYLKYRPKTLDEVIGQPDAVSLVRKYLKAGNLPHAILFSGGTGVGKTSMAHVIRLELGCKATTDFADLNCGVIDPMDTVKNISSAVRQRPLGGKVRVWIMEEFQSLARAGFAQQAMLRVLETAPRHNYFFLCTTDPSKVNKAVRGRCTEIRLKPIPNDQISVLILSVVKREGRRPPGKSLIDKIVDMADGSARNALVLLEKAMDCGDERGQHAALDRADPSKVAFDLVKALLPFNGRSSWKEVAKVLNDIADEEPEGIRQMVLASARKHLLNGGGTAGRAYYVIEAFRDPFFGQKSSDNALLAAACWSAVHAGSG